MFVLMVFVTEPTFNVSTEIPKPAKVPMAVAAPKPAAQTILGVPVALLPKTPAAFVVDQP